MTKTAIASMAVAPISINVREVSMLSALLFHSFLLRNAARIYARSEMRKNERQNIGIIPNPPRHFGMSAAFCFIYKFTLIAPDRKLSLATGVRPSLELRNHSACKHLVRNRGRHFVDEDNAHLRIALKKLYYLYFLR